MIEAPLTTRLGECMEAEDDKYPQPLPFLPISKQKRAVTKVARVVWISKRPVFKLKLPFWVSKPPGISSEPLVQVSKPGV